MSAPLPVREQAIWWQRLKFAWHQATFLEGAQTPCAKHLFNAIDDALKATREKSA